MNEDSKPVLILAPEYSQLFYFTQEKWSNPVLKVGSSGNNYLFKFDNVSLLRFIIF